MPPCCLNQVFSFHQNAKRQTLQGSRCKLEEAWCNCKLDPQEFEQNDLLHTRAVAEWLASAQPRPLKAKDFLQIQARTTQIGTSQGLRKSLFPTVKTGVQNWDEAILRAMLHLAKRKLSVFFEDLWSAVFVASEIKICMSS